MGNKKLTELGVALDKDNWEWLQGDNLEIATLVEESVIAGASPEEVKNTVRRHIGPERNGMLYRCVSAARYVQHRQTQ